MTSNLLSIAASGAAAAEIGLDVTGQNISNASTAGYVRRSVNDVELSSPAGTWSTADDVSLSGVAVSGIVRNADSYLQTEARRTASNTAQADATVSGLTDVETDVEDSGVFTAIGTFTNALTSLAQDPTDTSLRETVLQDGSTMTSAFQIAAQGLSATQSDQQGEVSDGVTQVNSLASQLATINTQLSATATTAASASDVVSSSRASLEDQRDSLLDQIGQYASISTTINSDGSVNVNLGSVSGPPLVSGSTTNTLSATVNSDGTESLSVGNAAVTLAGGSIAGNQAVLTKLNQISGNLDSLASSIATTVNTQQANGADLSGSTGTALFSGTTAATIAMATTDPSAIATAASGSAANSTDTTNLTAMNSALTTLAPADTMNGILTDISGSVASATTTQTTLQTLSTAAASSLTAQSGVDLNTEAVNLVKFQQAFQASSKVMQVAEDVFSSILNLSMA
jgi:flagellar hook-associated protein 1